MNKTRSLLLADKAALADSVFSRVKGLLGRRVFNKGEALVIRPCNSIHTFFMRFPIDALFIDGKNAVVGKKVSFKPWRISKIYWRARFVIELPCGVLAESNTSIGDEINIA
ncbi:MAG: DUF192 domain-containing protein [Candidatus Omnitrophota bacterium]